jgi:hypothetical protein
MSHDPAAKFGPPDREVTEEKYRMLLTVIGWKEEDLKKLRCYGDLEASMQSLHIMEELERLRQIRKHNEHKYPNATPFDFETETPTEPRIQSAA